MEPSSQTEGLAVLTTKLVRVSAVAGAFIILTVFVSFFIDMAQLESLLTIAASLGGSEKLGEMVKLELGLPFLLFPRYVFGGLLGLLVPVCGYYGATRLHAGCLGCFTFCSCLRCCCALVSLFWLLLAYWAMATLMPVVEVYVSDCDPSPCMQLTQPNERVDCLATGVPWYHANISGIPHLPQSCPTALFLDCSEDRPDADASEPAETGEVAEAGLPLDVPFLKALRLLRLGRAFKLRGRERAGSWEREETEESWEHAGPEEPWEHDGPDEAWQRDGRWGKHDGPDEAWQRDGRWGDGWRRHRRGPPPAYPTPKDWPIVDAEHCEINTNGTDIWHRLHGALPRAVPPVMTLIAEHILLLIPVVILGCLSMLWGKSLWRRVSMGYVQPAHPAVDAQPVHARAVHVATQDVYLQPDVYHMQPALGQPDVYHVRPAYPADAAAPLIPNAYPVLESPQ